MRTSEDDSFVCENCGTRFERATAIRRETIGGLDPDKWQTFCCPECGVKVKTVFVGDDSTKGG